MEFLKFLVLTNIGRLLLGAVIIFIGAVLVNEFDYLPVFYVGLVIFAGEAAYMVGYMIWNVIKEWL
jgi:hypothetical protein